jgi:DtxR family Mn-dependent transcriptional regulator
VEIKRISEQLQEDSELMRALAVQGLRPGATVVAQLAAGSVSVDGEVLPAGVAQHVFVSAMDEELTPAEAAPRL